MGFPTTPKWAPNFTPFFSVGAWKREKREKSDFAHLNDKTLLQSSFDQQLPAAKFFA